MRVFQLKSDGYIDPVSEFEYKHIMQYREAFPLVHNHDYFELFLIVEGTMQHFVNDMTIELQKGHLVFIRPKDVHSFFFEENGCQFLNLAILEKTIKEMFHYLGSGYDQNKLLVPELPPTLLLTKKELEEAVALFDNLNLLPVNDKSRLNIELRCILISVFSRFFVIRSRHEEDFPDWMLKVITKMKQAENFREGNKAIREIACKSDEHISRCFRKYLNQTPTQFINELKLNYAANQVRFSHKKINHIAFEAGFENLSNFHRQFKRMFNITPAEFRKANKSINVLAEDRVI